MQQWRYYWKWCFLWWSIPSSYMKDEVKIESIGMELPFREDLSMKEEE
jgi:hypothetical protein